MQYFNHRTNRFRCDAIILWTRTGAECATDQTQRVVLSPGLAGLGRSYLFDWFRKWLRKQRCAYLSLSPFLVKTNIRPLSHIYDMMVTVDECSRLRAVVRTITHTHGKWFDFRAESNMQNYYGGHL